MLDQNQKHLMSRAIISDDDEFFRVAICAVLRERNGFTDVIETSSFDEAVDHLGHTGPVDIGLFDLNMVGMENWLDLSAVRAEFPKMRMVVVSASRLRDDILKSLEIGAHGFIHKGMGVGELSRAVDLICHGQVYVPPFLPECFAETTLQDGQTTQIPDVQGMFCAQSAEGLENGSADQGSVSIESLRCSPRQREIIELLVAGQSNKGMARALNLSEGTIKFHMSAVFRLLGASGRVEAATRAMRLLGR